MLDTDRMMGGTTATTETAAKGATAPSAMPNMARVGCTRQTLSQWALQWPADVTMATAAPPFTPPHKYGSSGSWPTLAELRPSGCHACVDGRGARAGRQAAAHLGVGEREAVLGSAEQDATWHTD